MPMSEALHNLIKRIWDKAERAPDLQHNERIEIDGQLFKVHVTLRDPDHPKQYTIRIVARENLEGSP